MPEDSEGNVLENPKVREAIANLQSSYDKKIVVLEKQTADATASAKSLQDKLNEVLEQMDTITDKDVSDSGKVTGEAAKTFQGIKDRMQREAEEKKRLEVERTMRNYEAARRVAKEFAEYGVHMEDLLELSDEVAMNRYALDRGKEALTKTETDGTRVDLSGQGAAEGWKKLSLGERTGLAIKELEKSTLHKDNLLA